VSGALTSRTVDTGKGPTSRSHGSAYMERASFHSAVSVPDVPSGLRGFLCPRTGHAPEQEQSGAEFHFFFVKEGKVGSVEHDVPEERRKKREV
jgi:hypothetical protein